MIGRINCSLRTHSIFMFSGLHMRPKCVSSHPVDIDVFFTHQTLSLPVIPYYRPEPVLKCWVVHPAIRKLAFAHEVDDGCPVVEDMP